MPLRPSLPPILRDMQALRALGARRLALQALLTGGISGGVIGAFRLLYDAINEVVAARIGGLDLADPFAVLLVGAGLFVLAVAAWALVRYEPLISGSGIPQVELAIAGRLPMPWQRILWSKFAGTLVSLTAGLSVGREGPSIQMGAAVGCWVGRIWHDEGDEARPRYLIGGSVAGLAAAFGAPLAGLCFAFEEVKSVVSAPLVLFTGIAAGSAWFVVEGLFGFGLVFPFARFSGLSLPQWWLPLAAGALMGLLGVVYNALLMRMVLGLDRLRSLPFFVRVLLPFIASGCLLYAYPEVLVCIGPDVPELAELRLPLASLCLLLTVKVCFSCLSFSSGVAGGLLMPMLMAGGMAGACIASFLAGIGIIAPDQASALLTLGMAGLFAATVRAPLTGTALIVEMTGLWSFTPAVLASALAAVATANLLRSAPIYDSLRDRIIANRAA